MKYTSVELKDQPLGNTRDGKHYYPKGLDRQTRHTEFILFTQASERTKQQ